MKTFAMAETKVKALYKGKSIEELKPLYEVNAIIKGRKPRQLIESANKLLIEAEKLRLHGDEEMSYITYMKYLHVVTHLQSKDDYGKDKHYIKEMLGVKNINKALKTAEDLAESLQKRYKLLSEQQQIEAEELEKERLDAIEELNRKLFEENKPSPNAIITNGTPVVGLNDVSISSYNLYNLLSERKMSVLIMDSRSKACYDKSHMTRGNCINVPEEIIKPGISAAALEKLLPSASREAWSKRGVFDLIILLDWCTTKDTFSTGSTLHILKTVLLKWDPAIIYKSEPLILEGGYEDWVLRYPMCTTNPHAVPPRQTNLNALDDLLDDIDYPSLMDTNASIMLQPVIDRGSKPLHSSTSSESVVRPKGPANSTYHPRVSITTSEPSIRQPPGVDRTSKAVAMQTYEERSKAVSDLLRARETLTNDSLVLEKARLKAEKDLEYLRICREKEAEEEKRQYLQDREEQLLEDMLQLENKHREQEAENQSLREQLEVYRQKELEEANLQADLQRAQQDAEISERIRSKEEEKKRVAKEAEELLKERERKMAENRRKEVERAKKLEEERRIEKEKLEKERQAQENAGTYFINLKDAASTSSSMKRSHSSPNIAQMVDQEKTPHIDRTIKPAHKPQPPEIKTVRQRNFNPVYGTRGRGLTGLKNLGNSCYMNSIIQCINNTTPLAWYFCKGDYRDDVNYHNNTTRGEVAEEVAAVVRALWSGQFRSIACRDLKTVVGQHRKQFQGYEQQDSHEFLTILMDWLHEDLNKRSNKSPSKDSNKENLSPADKAWEEFLRSSESLIKLLFYGQQKSTVACCTCGEKSVTYEAFSDLSLPLPNGSSKCTLHDCIKLYLKGEQITGWNCPSCKEKRTAIKKFDIKRLPPILIIHLNRFYHDGWWRKRQTYVDFDLNLDMKTYTLDPDQWYTNYNLYGVSNHYGTMEGGHYTAYCKNIEYKKWYKFDDQEVSEISSSDVKSGAAYILFYASVEYKIPEFSRQSSSEAWTDRS